MSRRQEETVGFVVHGPGVERAARVPAHGARPIDLVPAPDGWWLGVDDTGA